MRETIRSIAMLLCLALLGCGCSRQDAERHATETANAVSASPAPKETASPGSAGEKSPGSDPAATGAAADAATAQPAPPQAAPSQNAKAHKAYRKFLQKDADLPGDRCRYAYLDIDGDGTDELIAQGDYYAAKVYTYADGTVKEVHCQKYGGAFRIYPGQGIIYFPNGGHMDHYYNQYVSLAGGESRIAAVMEWKNKFVPDPRHKGEYRTVCAERTYKINGKKTDRKAYQNYRRALRNAKSVTHRDLDWKQIPAKSKKP